MSPRRLDLFARTLEDFGMSPLRPASPSFRRTASGTPIGHITATPDLLPDKVGTITLKWEANVEQAEVHVAEEGEPEKLVAQGAKDSVILDWIRPGTRYVFRLYETSEPRGLIDEVAVSLPVVGELMIDPLTTASAFAGTVTIHWQITAPVAGEIVLNESGADGKVVSRGPSGPFSVEGLEAGVNYLFQLYAVTPERPLLAEANFFHPISGKISAAPNPIPLGAGSRTTLHWEITPPATAEVRLSGGSDKEKTVCRGPSGSFEVSGLRAGVAYLFRLYSQRLPQTLLDEVTVRVDESVWAELLEFFQSAGGAPTYSDELAKFIGAVLPEFLHQKNFSRWFREWEASGFHVTPVHFYEPIPDSRTLPESLWTEPLALPGIDLNDAQQFHLLTEVFPKFRAEYSEIPYDAPGEGNSFYLRNGRFEGLDPFLAYCMVRHYQPRQIIEVGSGFSTLILAQAALQNGDTELHSIEPYPEELLTRSVPGLTSLRPQKVEEVDVALFESLGSGDILFIDTSHVVRIGGDVNYLFLEVLPRLKPGVIVHVHDIFLPYEYPQSWVMERRRFWTEQYLLQAFLAFNSEFEVLVGSGYLKARFPEEVAATFPNAAPWQGGSFWMRRRPAAP